VAVTPAAAATASGVAESPAPTVHNSEMAVASPPTKSTASSVTKDELADEASLVDALGSPVADREQEPPIRSPAPRERQPRSPLAQRHGKLGEGDGAILSKLEQLQLQDSSSRYLPGYEESGKPQILPAPPPKNQPTPWKECSPASSENENPELLPPPSQQLDLQPAAKQLQADLQAQQQTQHPQMPGQSSPQPDLESEAEYTL